MTSSSPTPRASHETLELTPTTQDCPHHDQPYRQVAAIDKDVGPGAAFEKGNDSDPHCDPPKAREKSGGRSPSPVCLRIVEKHGEVEGHHQSQQKTNGKDLGRGGWRLVGGEAVCSFPSCAK